VPAAAPPVRQLSYYLGFLEYKEEGGPYPLVDEQDKPTAIPDGNSIILGQYSVLEKHFRDHSSNFVIAFVHGWRHDATIGDDNVANARTYAAHAARFFAERCASNETRYCGVTVTAIYIGWRGARVSESRLKRELGAFGEWLGTLTAIPTLFDRKPVSEEIGPSVVTALRGLNNLLISKGQGINKMIVFGHSLGGNMLMATMKDYLMKMVERYQPGNSQRPAKELLRSPVGDLVVLINPASEAANWTAVQRSVWNRIPYRESENVDGSTVNDGHRFFRQDQAPIVVSVTAARSWPVSGVRVDDCRWLTFLKEQGEQIGSTPEAAKKGQAASSILALIDKNKEMFKQNIDYDWATYDLFPAFKLDFRPVARTMLLWAERIAGRDGPPGNACSNPPAEGPWAIAAKPIRWLAGVLRTIPFMNTDREQTRTIGHLDPPRPPMGQLTSMSILPFRPFGTTHEMTGDSDVRPALVPYAQIGSNPGAGCPFATSWLWRARAKRIHDDPNSHGTFWDSNDLDSGRPAVEFRQSFAGSGTAEISRANDPFWNIRAFDTALSNHGGYLLSPFICAMEQIVIDRVAEPVPGP
jgi:hypothetical protein